MFYMQIFISYKYGRSGREPRAISNSIKYYNILVRDRSPRGPYGLIESKGRKDPEIGGPRKKAE